MFSYRRALYFWLCVVPLLNFLIFAIIESVELFKRKFANSKFAKVNAGKQILNDVKSIAFFPKTVSTANKALVFVFCVYLLPVICVMIFAAMQKLPCELGKNFEVTQFCKTCRNLFEEGQYDFDCEPMDGQDFFMDVLLASKNGVVQSGQTVIDYAEATDNFLLSVLHPEIGSVDYEIVDFIVAATRKDIPKLKELYGNDSSVIDERDVFNNTALILAARFGNLETVKYLIEIGANVTAVDINLKNAFHSAAVGRKNDILAFLDNLDPSLKLSWTLVGYNALIMATKWADTETVQFLIEEIGMSEMDLSRNRDDFGRNLFSLAAELGQIETCRYLDSLNPELKWEVDMFNNSALTLASKMKYAGVETVRFLIEDMGMIDRMNITVVGERAGRVRRGHTFHQDLLTWVPHSVSEDITIGQRGRNVFLAAAQGKQVETMRYLNSLDPTWKYDSDTPHLGNSNTAVTLAAQFADRITMQYLIEDMGLNISDKGLIGKNVFLLAVQNHDKEIEAKKKNSQINLLRYIDGLDPELKNTVDDNNNTALSIASSFADERTIKLLIEEFSMNVTTSLGFANRNSFLSAAFFGNVEVMRYLYSVDKEFVNSRDDGLSTALTLAAQGPPTSDYSVAVFIETVKMLIEEMEMDPSETGFADRNALMAAISGSMHELLPYFDSIDPDLKNTRDADDDVPLTLAVYTADMQTIRTVVEDLKVNASLGGYRGLNGFLLAAEIGRLEVLQYLQQVR